MSTLASDENTCGFADGDGTSARFYSPSGVAIDGDGSVFVADQSNHRVRKITATGLIPPTTIKWIPAVPASCLVEDMERLLTSGESADVTFIVGSTRIPAHRNSSPTSTQPDALSDLPRAPES